MNRKMMLGSLFVLVLILGMIAAPVLAEQQIAKPKTCVYTKEKLRLEEITGIQKYVLLSSAVNSHELKKLIANTNLLPSLLIKNAKVYKISTSSGKSATFAVFPIGYEKSKEGVRVSSVVVYLSNKIKPVKYTMTLSGDSVGKIEFYSLDKNGNIELIATAENGQIHVTSDDGFWECVVGCMLQECTTGYCLDCLVYICPTCIATGVGCLACAICLGADLGYCMGQCYFS